MSRSPLLLAIVSLVVSLFTAAPVRGAALHPLTLWLDWYPNTDHAGIYLALARGYYKSAGLDVTVRVPSGAASALQLVAHGSGDIAISYEADLLLARQHHLPVVATAAIVQQPLTCILALRSSGIRRPRQLEGQTVGIAGDVSDYSTIDAMVRADGGNPAHVKTVTLNYALLQGLLTRRVAAVEGVYWTWEALQAQRSGYAVTVMRLDHYGVPMHDELVFATGNAQVAHESALLRVFQRATFRGYAEAVAHPEAAVQALRAAKEVMSTDSGLLRQSIALLAPLFHDAHGRYGTLSVTQWQTYADWMQHHGLLAQHVAADSAVTTALLP